MSFPSVFLGLGPPANLPAGWGGAQQWPRRSGSAPPRAPPRGALGPLPRVPPDDWPAGRRWGEHPAYRRSTWFVGMPVRILHPGTAILAGVDVLLSVRASGARAT
ncbi:MAG TPA: hypothetical protein VFJ22_13840 [Dermatophilaceae bacterium]|nr:hypothetical protein [Dermatophilaceae bacterium]